MAGSMRRIVSPLALAVAAATACTSSDPGNSPPPPSSSFVSNPCSPSSTVTLAAAGTAVLDCSGGGTTVTLAAAGASYLIVPQFATNLVANQLVPYSLGSGTIAAAIRASSGIDATSPTAVMPPRDGPGAAQARFEAALFERNRALVSASTVLPATRRGGALLLPPTLGSTRDFRVLSNETTGTFGTVTATLAYLGNNVYLYVDNAAPANGFTASQLTDFGQLFDQTFYTVATAAFGSPSDVDGNGHVIMLISPVVNALSPASRCATEGYIAGYFTSQDFNGASDPNSNQGEVFYSVAPDPAGTVSCTHSVASIGQVVPATFIHELQHLINYSQHVVVNRGLSLSSWLDEGMSILSEELGSLYYENKCPPPSCRTNPAQLFPDSSQGFAQGFLYDSYQYALGPDTASITLHQSHDAGFGWHGGAYLLVRYLGDQFGAGVFRSLETGPSDALAAITAATGRPFAATFANYGLALYADSFPGLPRATAPTANRFTTRNLRQLWARIFVTSHLAREMPLQVKSIQSATTAGSSSMVPGTMSFWRLDTSPSDATVSIRFATPAGGTFGSALRGQVAIMRLPTGQ